MKTHELNLLVENLRTGKMSEKEVIDKIAVFVIKNYPIYGLHKYDEDFRQDILLGLLERGPHLLHLFNPNYGDFFTFLYCYICTLINSKLKTCAQNSIREKLNFEECVQQYEEKEIKYHRINYQNFEVPKIPFNWKKLSTEEFQRAIKDLSLHSEEKKVLILALKSSYYLTDKQIHRICNMYGIDPEQFYQMIQYCKETLDFKRSRLEKEHQKRNFAYYHHKRYRHIIKKYQEDDFFDNKYFIKDLYIYRERKHKNSMVRLNTAFQKGYLYLRTTNKTVANVMGLSERQVNYYMRSVRNEYKNQEDLPEKSTSSDTEIQIAEKE